MASGNRGDRTNVPYEGNDVLFYYARLAMWPTKISPQASIITREGSRDGADGAKEIVFSAESYYDLEMLMRAFRDELDELIFDIQAKQGI